MTVLWVLLSVVAIAAIAWLLARMLHDAQQVVGFLVLALVVFALLQPVAMTFPFSASMLGPALRTGISLLVLAIALFTASRYWTRRSLRWTTALGLALIGALLLDIGRSQAQRVAADQAIRELSTVEASLAVLDAPAQDASSELESTLDQAIADLEVAIQLVSTNAALAAAAELLYHDLTQQPIPDFEAHLAGFNTLYSPTAASTPETSLKEAVDAAVSAAQATPPDPQPTIDAIAAACAIAEGQGADHKEVTCGDDIGGDTLSVSMAVVRLRLAEYRLSVLGRDEDASAVETLTAELSDTQAMVDPSLVEPSVSDALVSGAEAVVADLPGQSEDVPIVLDALGWTLLAILVLAGWRVIERRSAQQMAGPVTLSLGPAQATPPTTAASGVATGDATATTKAVEPPTTARDPGGGGTPQPAAAPTADSSSMDVQRTVFRTALLRNLPEPSATPGADALTSVTDLVELTGAATTLITKIVAAIKSIATRPAGYQVAADLVQREAGEKWQALVRITDQATGVQVAVHDVVSPTPLEASRAAGYWAAADILARSTRIPSWATWDPDTAESLSAYHEAETRSADALRNALALAPSSGLLLNELGNCYDLEGKHRDALVLYTRAATIHPRYFVARYRMAVSVTMIASGEEGWTNVSLSERQRLAEELRRGCTRLRVATTSLTELPGVDDAQAKAILNSLARRLFQRIQHDWRPVELLGMALNKSERVVWWGPVWSLPKMFGPAARGRWLIRSALLIEDDAELSRVMKRARNQKAWWQLSYNLACYFARQQDPDEALDWLEVALERPGSGQMGGGWLEKDPDLKSLHALPRFRWIAAQLERK